MTDGKVIYQANEIIRKTYTEINKMIEDLRGIFQTTKPRMEFYSEYSYRSTELQIRKWHVIVFNEKSNNQSRKKGGLFFVMVFIFSNNNETKRLTDDEPELWCGLLNIDRDIHLWETADLTDDKEYFNPQELKIGGYIHRYLYDKKDKYGKWEGDFIGYRLIDICSVEKLKELIVNKLFTLLDK